jgi:hypothetical protein
MFIGRVGETMEIGNRAADAVQTPVDEHANGSRPYPHDFVDRQGIDGLAEGGHGRFSMNLTV